MKKVIKIIKKSLLIVLVVAAVYYSLSFALLYILADQVRPYSSPLLENKLYLYDTTGIFETPIAVTTKGRIDNMNSYCNSKLFGHKYDYNNISVLYKMNKNQLVYLQEYIQDSTIAIVSYKSFHPAKTDSVYKKLYVPVIFLHKTPTEQ